MAEHGSHISQCWSGRLQARKGGGYNSPDGNGYSWRHQYELMLIQHGYRWLHVEILVDM